MRYFQVRSDMLLPDRWVLGEPVDESGQEIDSWRLTEGRPLEMAGVARLPLALAGVALDYSHTTLNIPVLHARLVPVFERLGAARQAQFIPARVEGHAEPYVLLNVLRSIRCIREEGCEEVRRAPAEGSHAPHAVEYELVRGLRIDPQAVGDAHLFRPAGWHVALLVSEPLKRALEQEGMTGAQYIEA